MPMPTAQVLIVGSGPTGLTLACDLARRSVAVRIIDKSPDFPRSSRAKGPNPRSLEVLEDLGIVDRVLAAGSMPPPMRKYRNGLPIADTDPFEASRPTPDTPYDRPWMVAQWRLEEILRDRLAEYGVHVELDAEATGLAAGPESVTVTLADGRSLAARYVVGCDGGHSLVRKLLGIPFEGKTTEEQMMVCGDVEADGLDRGYWHQWFDEDGAVLLCPIPGTRSGWWFQAGPERDRAGAPVPPSLESFRRLLRPAHRTAGHPADAGRPAVHVPGQRAHGRPLPGGPRPAGRGRRACALHRGRAGHEHRDPGRVQPGLEARPGRHRPVGSGPAGHVRGGAAAGGLLDAGHHLRAAAGHSRSDQAAGRRPGRGGHRRDHGPDAWLPLELALPHGLHHPRLRAGDRAPDAPCRDAATGAPTRLFEAFAGPHFTLLGFGPGTADTLRATEAAYGDAVRAYGVGAGGPADLADEAGHARTAYGIEPGADILVLVRPDNHVALISPAADSQAVGTYMDRLSGTAFRRL